MNIETFALCLLACWHKLEITAVRLDEAFYQKISEKAGLVGVELYTNSNTSYCADLHREFAYAIGQGVAVFSFPCKGMLYPSLNNEKAQLLLEGTSLITLEILMEIAQTCVNQKTSRQSRDLSCFSTS